MHRLTFAVRQGSVAAVKSVVKPFPQHALRNLPDERVQKNVLEQVRRERRRILLNVAAIEIERRVGTLEDRLQVVQHLDLELIEMRDVDDALQDNHSVVVDRVASPL